MRTKNYLLCFSILVIIFSCNTPSSISNDFKCSVTPYSNLETLQDFKKNFTIKLPDTWKINFYYDNVVSSIYTADTTLSLTKTTVIDTTYVLTSEAIDEAFIQKIILDEQQMALQEIKSKQTTFLERPSYYRLSKGKKEAYNYQVLNIFTKVKNGFLHLKTEVYGDSLVDERICKALDLFDEIELD